MKDYLIAIDAMGGDNAPFEIIKGAIEALNENKQIKIILVGKEQIIAEELKKYTYDTERIKIQNATEVIETCESPTNAIRNKKDSSIVVGLKLVKEEKADAFISAGSTGAVLTGATIITKRIKGIERPALATLLPAENGKYVFLIDAGANMDCKPSYLLQFAKMGQIYMENIMGLKNAKIGLVNVGTESEKGDLLTKETFKILEADNEINFFGNIEARDIPKGIVDVIVCDGFVGNVILKLCEGVTKSFSNIVKNEIKSNILYSIGGIISKGAFNNVKKRFDYSEVGGAPFLGLKGLVVKAHGSSNSKAIKNAVNQCYKFIQADIVSKIEMSIQNGNIQ